MMQAQSSKTYSRSGMCSTRCRAVTRKAGEFKAVICGERAGGQAVPVKQSIRDLAIPGDWRNFPGRVTTIAQGLSMISIAIQLMLGERR
jgi:hypothetical protein